MLQSADAGVHRATRPESVELLRPERDVDLPAVSVVIPSLNERLTIRETVQWCQEGFTRAGVVGEVIIVDSSDDETPEIALEEGARVLRVPLRGLGRAYIDAVPFIRGDRVVVGDADCTYDFRQMVTFLEKLDEGYEFVMGSRFKGNIEQGAMPIHHRYFGTPATNAIFNIVFRTRFSDIHCGMRAMTRDALVRIDLISQTWEYASEMIIKAVHLGLRSTEVPIDFYRDRNGRVSNVKRGGWWTPWKAGWDSLRIMFVFGADFFLVIPGVVLAVAGFLGSALLALGPRTFAGVTLTLHTQALLMAITMIGLFASVLGAIARMVYDTTGVTSAKWAGRLGYNRTVLCATAAAVAGGGLDAVFLAKWIGQGYRAGQALEQWSHLAMAGLLLLVVSFVAFTTCLVVQALHKLGSRGAE